MEEPDDSGAPGSTPRAKAILLVVVVVVMLATLVLCCVAASQLGVLIQLRLPQP